MRKKFVAGNWKMNKDIHETAQLIEQLAKSVGNPGEQVGVAVFPAYPSLVIAKSLLEGLPIHIGAQDMSEHDSGAYTGEVSATMLRSAGCTHVILGHSERRQYFKESDELIRRKVGKALQGGLIPVVCVGETLEEREAGITEQVISNQVRTILNGSMSDDITKMIIAYEPVWAIGTGKNATPDQADQVHFHIRKLVGQIFSWNIAEESIILYGGSVNSENAGVLLTQPNIDGALVGGASLKVESFVSIIKAAQQAMLPG